MNASSICFDNAERFENRRGAVDRTSNDSAPDVKIFSTELVHSVPRASPIVTQDLVDLFG